MSSSSKAKPSFPKLNNSTQNVFTIRVIRIVLTLFAFFLLSKLISISWDAGNIISIDPEGKNGDCVAIGPRRPVWDNRNDILRSIPLFLKIYETRPFKINSGGMRFDHSFGLWYMLKSISPSPDTVIESGARRGHSTWLIKQALPSVRVISLSPEAPLVRYENVLYFNKENFTDFGQFDWNSFGLDPKRTVVLFDDHQSAFRRIFREGMLSGFSKYIMDDNYGFQKGDNLNMKWLCETERKEEWSGAVLDNLGKIKTPQTWSEHILQVNELRQKLITYYEFPPTVSQQISNAVSYDEAFAPAPLIRDVHMFNRLMGKEYISELRNYVHICYVETI